MGQPTGAVREEQAALAEPERLGAAPLQTALAPTVARVLALQRSAGNAAVARMLKADHASSAPAGPAAPAPAAEPSAPAAEGAEAPGAEGAEAEAEQTGTIEDIEGEELTTGGCDAALSRLTRALPVRGDLRINPNITVEVSAGPGEGRGRARHDAINQVVSVGSKLTEDASAPGPGEFGAEKVTYKVDNIKWTHRPATKTVDVNARVFLDIKWGVHSLGNTNVSGPTDAVVTNATWKEIADDLRPDGTGRPTRDKYWAQDLTAKHEKFHATDDIGRANTYLPTARAWLGSQTVSAGSVEADVKAHLESMRAKVEADGWAWYGTGGEDRAYADGKSSYEGRVKGIEALAVSKKW